VKVCYKCKEEKPATAQFFYRDKSRKDGLTPRCRDCIYAKKETGPRRWDEKPDRIRCLACKEEYDYTSENFYVDKDYKFGLQTTRCKLCKDKASAQWRVDNREYDLERQKEKSRLWRQNNPEKARAKWQLRKARKKSNGAYEYVDYITVAERDRWVCQICQEEVDPEIKHPDRQSGSLDHVVPLSKGGAHTYDNTQLAHLFCNMKKSNK